VPEREPQVPAELLVDQLDRVERLPRVRALVVAVLDDQRAGRRAADVIHFVVQRQGQLAVIRYRFEAHKPPPGLRADSAGWRFQKPTCWRMRTMWMRPGSSWRISRIFPTWLCCP
jgi:hypothetical protein